MRDEGSDGRVLVFQAVRRTRRLAGIIAQADIATRLNKDRTTRELVEAISEGGNSRR